jgi:hypothetical protein
MINYATSLNPNKFRQRVNRLLAQSSVLVLSQNLIVLSQFFLSLEGIDVPSSTISACRGMETPVVIVVAGFNIDDITLALALGRATTRAYIIVSIELLVGLSGVKSDFLRKGVEKIDHAWVLDQNARAPTSRFIVNRLRKYAGIVKRHEIFGEGFVYAKAHGGDGSMKATSGGATAEFSLGLVDLAIDRPSHLRDRLCA